VSFHACLPACPLCLQEAIKPRNPKDMQEIAKQEGYGPLFSTFGCMADGLRACDAVDSLVDASAIDTLLSNFIIPLQSDDISKPDASGEWALCVDGQACRQTGRQAGGRVPAAQPCGRPLSAPIHHTLTHTTPLLPHCTAGVYRVHCSLNINTETGRLSARRPNLQNQPALEKDRYKVGGRVGGKGVDGGDGDF
jgi:DNA polymerase-1